MELGQLTFTDRDGFFEMVGYLSRFRRRNSRLPSLSSWLASDVVSCDETTEDPDESGGITSSRKGRCEGANETEKNKQLLFQLANRWDGISSGIYDAVYIHAASCSPGLGSIVLRSLQILFAILFRPSN